MLNLFQTSSKCILLTIVVNKVETNNKNNCLSKYKVLLDILFGVSAAWVYVFS